MRPVCEIWVSWRQIHTRPTWRSELNLLNQWDISLANSAQTGVYVTKNLWHTSMHPRRLISFPLSEIILYCLLNHVFAGNIQLLTVSYGLPFLQCRITALTNRCYGCSKVTECLPTPERLFYPHYRPVTQLTDILDQRVRIHSDKNALTTWRICKMHCKIYCAFI